MAILDPFLSGRSQAEVILPVGRAYLTIASAGGSRSRLVGSFASDCGRITVGRKLCSTQCFALLRTGGPTRADSGENGNDGECEDFIISVGLHWRANHVERDQRAVILAAHLVSRALGTRSGTLSAMPAKKKKRAKSSAKPTRKSRKHSVNAKTSKKASKKKAAQKRITSRPRTAQRKKRGAVNAENELQREFQGRNLTRGSSPTPQTSDFEGLSRDEQADSESVDELVAEGNLAEAGAVAGVEEADSADEKEVQTHEVPEDDVPQEYLDKD